MKNTLILLLLLCLACTIQAQENQESSGLVAGGSLSLTNSKQESTNPVFSFPITNEVYTNKNFSVSVNPYIGKQLSSRTIAGIGLIAGHSIGESFLISSNNESAYKNTNTTLGLELFYRYYLTPSIKINFFIQPSIGFSTSFGKIEQAAPALEQTKGNNYFAGINLGAIYSFSSKWHLLVQIAGANYQYSKSRRATQDESVTSGNFNINTSLSNLRIGIERRF